MKSEETLTSLSGPYPAFVYYGLPIGLALEGAGYSMNAELIATDASLSGKRCQETKIFHVLSIKRRMENEEVLALTQESGLRNANTEELIAFSNGHPDMLSVIALGTTYEYNGIPGVPWARKRAGGKVIAVELLTSPWLPKTKFLLVED